MSGWRAAWRYRRWPWLFIYAHGKIWLDPGYPAVREELRGSALPLLDLGCGVGLLASYLRAGGFKARIEGVDADPGKIEIANRAVADERTSFAAGDVRDFTTWSGNVVMLDVIHYLDDAAQRALVAKIVAGVAPGGVALIRLTLDEPNWRFAATKVEEWWIQLSRWIPARGGNFPTRGKMDAAFPGGEFTCVARPMWGLTPFNSYLFVYRRTAGE